tara:strand:- start:757 stop:1008 length:252 start_codon:yes stop_codon:yes gene_type:complete
MKKYKDVLAEQAAKHKPLTVEELNSLEKFGNSTEKHLLDEIMYLRSVIAECYMWMGRRPQTPLPKKYQWAMGECWRIHTEGKE